MGNKNLDYIAATPFLIDALSHPAETQEEAKGSWIMAYHFIKRVLEEDNDNQTNQIHNT